MVGYYLMYAHAYQRVFFLKMDMASGERHNGMGY